MIKDFLILSWPRNRSTAHYRTALSTRFSSQSLNEENGFGTEPEVDDIEREFVCPIPDCFKAYKHSSGLRYHIKHVSANRVCDSPHWPKICSSRDTLGIYLCNYQKFLQLSLANFRRRQGGCAEKPIPRSCDNTVGCHQRSDCLVVFVVMRFFLYLGQISNGRNFHPHQYRKVPSSLKFQMHHRHHQLSPFAVMISCIFQNAPCRNIVSNKYQAHSFVLSILSTYWTFEFTSGPPTLLGSCCTTSKYLWWYRNPLSPPNGWLFDIVNLFW